MPPAPWLHHISLSVTDLDRSAAWYRRALDLGETARRDGPTWRKILLRSGSFVLSLTAHEGTAAEGSFDETTVGLDHVAIGCRDRSELDAWIAHLEAVDVPHAPITEAPHAHLVTCRDPDGTPVEFYWPVP